MRWVMVIVVGMMGFVLVLVSDWLIGFMVVIMVGLGFWFGNVLFVGSQGEELFVVFIGMVLFVFLVVCVKYLEDWVVMFSEEVEWL